MMTDAEFGAAMAAALGWCLLVAVVAGSFWLCIDGPRLVGRIAGTWAGRRGGAQARLNVRSAAEGCFRSALPCEQRNTRAVPRVQRCTTSRPTSQAAVVGVTSDPGSDHQQSEANLAEPSEAVKLERSILMDEPPESRETEPEAPRKQTAVGCYSSEGRNEPQANQAGPGCFRKTPCEVSSDPGDARPVPEGLNERVVRLACDRLNKLRSRLSRTQAHMELLQHIIDDGSIREGQAEASERRWKQVAEKFSDELRELEAVCLREQIAIAEHCRRESELEEIGNLLARSAVALLRPESPEAEAASYGQLEDALTAWWCAVPAATGRAEVV